MIKCSSCNTNKANTHPQFGVTHCDECQGNERRPGQAPEFTTDRIRSGRREFRKDTIQPRRDGVLSREYLEQYGTTGIDASKKEIKNAKYTYKDLKGWHSRHKSRGGRSQDWQDKNVSREYRKI